MTFVITEACVDVMDRACVDQCPVDCIQPGDRMLYINPDQCIDCGACEPACPQGAVFADYNTPEPLAPYLAVNAEFFSGAGGSAGADHPTVAALPGKIG
jgi:NAD-dependent dihydropyrimidine dehydrogenase PreA subunit